MSFVQTSLPTNLGGTLVTDTSVNGTVQYATSGVTVYAITIDNTANNVVSYFKVWDATSGVTVGTTDPVGVIRVAASSKRTISSADGIFILGTGFAYACVTTGGTGGTTGPSSAVSLIAQVT